MNGVKGRLFKFNLMFIFIILVVIIFCRLRIKFYVYRIKIFVGLDEIKFGKLIEWGYFNKFLSYGKIN